MSAIECEREGEISYGNPIPTKRSEWFFFSREMLIYPLFFVCYVNGKCVYLLLHIKQADMRRSEHHQAPMEIWNKYWAKKKKEFSSFEIRKHCHIHTRPPYSDVRSIILDFACCSISCDSPLGGRNTESNMITDYQIPRRPVDFYAEAHHMQWTWQLNTRTGVHRTYINLWWKRWPPHRTV